MNEQQLQQLITIQQALAAAATAAVINSLLNPQQAAGLVSANALADPTNVNDLQQQLQQHQQQQQQQQENPHSPATTSPATTAEANSRIQDLLLQLHQQASVGNNPMALNLNLGANQQAANQLIAGSLGSPLSNSRSPISNRLNSAQELNATTLATSSNTHQLQQSNQVSPLKKLKSSRHHQAQLQTQQYRSSEATSKPQHSTPKNHSNISNLSSNRNTSGNNTTSSSTSSPFISSNNVGLPRKLVRGQDVWLGRGAEQTRQILKCMWCGQSFRTLAEMTQHMKITQHYTNIISQEQITSWRQPESSESATTAKQNCKQTSGTSQVRNNLDDNHDDLSDKFNDSDRDDNFSNDDDLGRESPSKNHSSNRLENPHHHHHHQQQQQQQQQHHSKTESSDDNHSTTESNHGDSPKAFRGSPNSKPLTRSKRRENDTLQSTKRRNGSGGRSDSPAASSYSQQQRQNINSGGSNLILGDSNDGNSETKEKKTKTTSNGKTSRENLDAVLGSSRKRKLQENDDDDEDATATAGQNENGSDANENDVKDSSNENDDKDQQLESDGEKSSSSLSVKNQLDEDQRQVGHEDDQEHDDEYDDKLKRDAESRTIFGRLPPVGKDRRLKEKLRNVDGDGDEDEDDKDGREQIQDDSDDGPDGNNDDDEQRSETNESVAINTTTTTTTTSGSNAKKGETGDPLSALETMVEKSFDPRMRPGVATGGILQRLGIDEEVCPPWQHINYANWYAAAAYGHPMAAALLAAGINLQNGIKLSKNVDPKKSDDCG